MICFVWAIPNKQRALKQWSLDLKKNMEIDPQTFANQHESIPPESEFRNAFDDNIMTKTSTSTERNVPSTSVGMKTNSLDGITPTATSRPCIGQIVNSQSISLGDQATMDLIDRSNPLTGLTFLSKKYVDKRKLDGFCKRYCQQQWFELFTSLATQSQDRLYCLSCFLYSFNAVHGLPSAALVMKPYLNWKDARTDLVNHRILQYHKTSDARMKAFISSV